jgi:hypothetical protein
MTGDTKRPRTAGAFDIRNFIGMLLGIYGLILLLTGFLGTDEAALDKSGGVNVNVWTGVGLVVSAGLFLAWAKLRPVVVPPSDDEE